MYTSERLSEVKNSVFLGFVNCKNALIIDNFDLFMLCERPTLFKLRIHTHYYALKWSNNKSTHQFCEFL